MIIRTASVRHRLHACAMLVFTVAVVYSFSRTTAAPPKREKSFLGYLFQLLSADEVPAAPELSAAERQAIDKLETLLKAQSERSPECGNYILLAAIAAARNDVAKADFYLCEASCRSPDSPLPLTMTAQVYAQAGDFERAKASHTAALSKVGKAGQSPALAANSYMDLAVVYAKSGDPAGARKLLKNAEAVLLKASRDRRQAALGWLQMGIVFTDSLNDHQTAVCAWKNGSLVLENSTVDEGTAALKIDLDVRIADNLIVFGQFADAACFLDSASRVLNQLSADSRPEAQFRIGSSYVELAIRNPNNGTYTARASALLCPLTEQDVVPPGTLGAHRDAALAHARLVRACCPQQADQLIAKALKWTLQIGEMDSVYAPVFSRHLPPSPPANTLQIELTHDSLPDHRG